MRVAMELIYQATGDVRGFVGHLDHADGAMFWRLDERAERTRDCNEPRRA
jgi:hypothetical protein